MNLREMKVLAEKNGINYAKNFGEKKMRELLESRGIELDQEYDASKQGLNDVSGNYLREIKDVALAHKLASTPLEKKQAEQAVLLLRAKINDSGDHQSLIAFLKWQRSRRLISVQDDYLLNELEMNDIPEDRKALCIRRLPISGIRAVVSESYPYVAEYKGDYVNKATKEMGNTFYTFYVPKVISGDKQVGKELAQKIIRGFHPKEGDYKEDRILVNKHTLIESEFVKYFQVEDEIDLEV